MRERRLPSPLDGPAQVVCRVCYSHVALEPTRIVRDGYYSVFRCPSCGGSFPVRTEDAASVRA
ncbi:MAG TPA: hypothetical protein VI854_09810 [Acidimicrobiia bacterium]|nr:hypothetical protein [Acidimicrobiia bacterium]